MMSVADLTTTGGPAALVVFDIPAADHDEWLNSVSAQERARIREVLAALAEIRRARNVKAGSEAAAMKRHHLGWGWSPKGLRNLYYAFLNGGHKPGDLRRLGPVYPAGDWRILLREYKGQAPALPQEFTRWLGEQLAEFKGRTDTVRALWRHVVQEIWLKGRPVPAYGTVDEWCRRAGRARPHPLLIRPGELPAGWSERTFRRALPRRRAVRQQLAHGYLAAHAHQADQVLTDRGPLMPLQYVFLDDSRPDLRCTYFAGGRGELVYPLLVLGLDACSGVPVANVAKPRALKEDDSGRHGVTQDMALLVVLETIRKYGVPPWGITFVHENAAACVPAEARAALREAFGDLIRFEATGVVKQKLAEHGFTEGGGAPYDKAPIEAFWRILMTQIARLPGSTGPRYDTAPAELKQIERYQLGLMERAGGLVEVFKRFQSPLLDFDEAHAAIEAALRILNFRTAHKLQGFERVREWRPTAAEGFQPWDRFLALPETEQNAISATPGNVIERLECPAERFCRLLLGVEMTPVDPDFLAWIEGPRFPATVRDGKITVRRTALGNDDLVFRETDHPLLDVEAEGRTYEAALTREADRIVLTDAGRILGGVELQGRVSRADKAVLHREQGRVAAARKADRTMLAEFYLADTNDALGEMRRRNEAVQAALPMPEAPAPKVTAGQSTAQKKRNRKLSDQLAAAAERQLARP
jgi:hypothetical protein